MAINQRPVDWCQVAASLREKVRQVAAGETVTLIRYRGNEVERETRFSIANIAELRAELRIAEQECAKTQGMPYRNRHAIVFRGRW